MGVAQIAETYDEDGVDVYFLNSKRVGKELKVGKPNVNPESADRSRRPLKMWRTCSRVWYLVVVSRKSTLHNLPIIGG